MNIMTIRRAILRLRCKHKRCVWLREWTDKPQGGVYPVKCCLDCGKLTWATITAPGHVTYLNPIKVTSGTFKPPQFTPKEDDGTTPRTSVVGD